MDKLNCSFRETCFLTGARDNFGQRLVGVICFFSTAQYQGVSTFNAETGEIDGNIGTAFINTGNYAKRYAFFSCQQAVGEGVHFYHFADWVWKRHYLQNITCHPLDS